MDCKYWCVSRIGAEGVPSRPPAAMAPGESHDFTELPFPSDFCLDLLLSEKSIGFPDAYSL
ncbi:hypothetical protein J3R73_005636 [Labrys monachus]|jgi:hypothetical protein|uniref:Uncharacterized protein n=1 Tax=Labrys monachus TaxID=217067 RepID=A0ABU0FMK2_9HYPH|nr:hypothetical protein [Labrys monachus]